MPPPSDPQLRERIAALRSRLDELVAQLRAGKAKTLVDSAPQLADEIAATSYAPLEAEARCWVSEIHDQLGDGEAAEAQLRLAMDAAARGRDDAVLSRALNGLVWVLGHHQQRYAEADALAQVAKATAQRLGDERQQATLTFYLGVIEEDRGHYDKARGLLANALATRKRLLGEDHPEVGSTYQNLAVVLDELGEYKAAREHFERAFAIIAKAYGPEHPAVGSAHVGLGNSFRRTGDYAAARPHFEASLRIWREALGPEHPYVGMGLNNLMLLLHDMGDFDAALEVGQRALAFKEKHAGPESASTANTLANIARLLHEMKRTDEARAHWTRALAIRRKVLEPSHPDTATALTALAMIASETGDHAGAIPMIKEALAIREQLGPDHPELLAELNAAARIELARGRPGAAIPYLERALAISDKKQSDPMLTGETKMSLAAALWAANKDRARAIELARGAREVWQELGPGAKKQVDEANDWLRARGQ